MNPELPHGSPVLVSWISISHKVPTAGQTTACSKPGRRLLPPNSRPGIELWPPPQTSVDLTAFMDLGVTSVDFSVSSLHRFFLPITYLDKNRCPRCWSPPLTLATDVYLLQPCPQIRQEGVPSPDSTKWLSSSLTWLRVIALEPVFPSFSRSQVGVAGFPVTIHPPNTQPECSTRCTPQLSPVVVHHGSLTVSTLCQFH